MKSNKHDIITFNYTRNEKILSREIQKLNRRLKSIKENYDISEIKKTAIEHQLKILLDNRGKLKNYNMMIEHNFIKEFDKRIKHNLMAIEMIKLRDGSYINKNYIVSIKKSVSLRFVSEPDHRMSIKGSIYHVEIIVPDRQIQIDYKYKKLRDKEFDRIVGIINK